MMCCVTFSASLGPYSPWQEYFWCSVFQSTGNLPQPSKTGVFLRFATSSIFFESSQKISHSSLDSARGATAAPQ